ncbi:MAG TPA: SDR family NAD(P)-dependent oxidoreductase [Caulobacteraceae bacterium]|nr:SDR family NAD(P)-dependent oxidoreductase [Caulobacteraceae bacterium]
MDRNDLKRKVVAITGASSGIGFETARTLAGAGAQVVMICRDRERGDRARAEIAGLASASEPLLVVADLASLADVRRAADEVRSIAPRLDVLINNAGGVTAAREQTVDGLERTFAVNHLAPFLLTHLLLAPLSAAPAGRVVTVASEVYPSRLDFGNLQGERSYQFLDAYTRSKLANILFTFELARRLADTPITANCMSPGPTRTRFGDNLAGPAALFPLVMKNIPFLFKDVSAGASTVIYLAVSPSVAGISGSFFMRNQVRATKAVTRDLEVAARLWRISEELCDGTAPLSSRAQRPAALPAFAS